MRRAKLIGKVSYRLTDEEWREIEEQARAKGGSVHDWCREAALEKLRGERSVMGENERLIWEEIARCRHLIANGFGLMSTATLTPDEWRRLLGETDNNPAGLAQKLFEKRRVNGSPK